MNPRIPTTASIARAREDLEGVIHPTRVMTCSSLSQMLGLEQLYLKPECLQRTGSFKFRGAYTKVHRLAPSLQGKGVVAFSSGNHGQAVALAAKLHGLPALIVLPEDVVAEKEDACRAYGAEVRLAGRTSLERKAVAEEIATQRGWTIVPPFDDPDIVSGQATVGLEILEEAPDTDAVLVPVGGGGLSSGVTLAVKRSRPDVKVIGVEPSGADDARRSLEAGEIVAIEHPVTLADGLRTSRIGDLNFEILRERSDGVRSVSEDGIMRAVFHLALRAKLVVEPSGAVGLAALMEGALIDARRPTVLLSGGNVSPATFSRLLRPS